MVEINFKCEKCDFSFLDKSLIFYLDSNLDDLEAILNFYENDENTNDHLELIEDSHNKENSDKMTKLRPMFLKTMNFSLKKRLKKY